MEIRLSITKYEAEKLAEFFKKKERKIPSSLLARLYIVVAVAYFSQPRKRLNEETRKWISNCRELAIKLEKSQGPYWQTRDGEVMFVSDMKDSHLMNTIRLLRRNAIKRVILEDSKKSVKRILMLTSYSDLVKEAEKRGLISIDK